MTPGSCSSWFWDMISTQQFKEVDKTRGVVLWWRNKCNDDDCRCCRCCCRNFENILSHFNSCCFCCKYWVTYQFKSIMLCQFEFGLYDEVTVLRQLFCLFYCKAVVKTTTAYWHDNKLHKYLNLSIINSSFKSFILPVMFYDK